MGVGTIKGSTIRHFRVGIAEGRLLVRAGWRTARRVAAGLPAFTLGIPDEINGHIGKALTRTH